MPLSPRVFFWFAPAALAAASVPSLLAFNVAPSATFLNQALALFFWGLLALATAHECELDAGARRSQFRSALAPSAVLLLVAVAAAVAGVWGGLPSPLALSGMGSVAAAGVLLMAGARAGAVAPARAAQLLALFCLGWLLAGLLNALVAVIQVFLPTWADGDVIARSALPGRAVGNLRQPNHLCTLLLWSAIATLALHELRLLRVRVTALCLAVLAFALVLTASRTAVIGVVLMALWGLLDRRLSRAGRICLVALPLLYAAFWAAMALWASWSHEAFGGQTRLAEADLSASRFRIWSDTLVLIRAHPWTGVGFGEFNRAWSLTPLPNRPPAFFDHSHNLFLEWAVEFGLPMAVLISLLLLLTLWRIAQAARAPGSGDASLALRATLAMLLMIALHSQLEYPLWYAYFLLPTAWLLGFGASLARQTAAPAPPVVERAPGPVGSVPLALAAAVLSMASVAAVADYTRVAAIFDNESAVPLADRMARGQRSWLFGHHADYAVATVSAQPQDELAAFSRASHYLLDTRLMTGWADAWAAQGDTERARHLAARLREFRNPHSADYFASCAAHAASSPAASSPAAAAALPYQCQPPSSSSALGWKDFP